MSPSAGAEEEEEDDDEDEEDDDDGAEEDTNGTRSPSITMAGVIASDMSFLGSEKQWKSGAAARFFQPTRFLSTAATSRASGKEGKSDLFWTGLSVPTPKQH